MARSTRGFGLGPLPFGERFGERSRRRVGMQRVAEAAEREVLRELEEPRGAIAALEPGSGEMRALVGGRG